MADGTYRELYVRACMVPCAHRRTAPATRERETTTFVRTYMAPMHELMKAGTLPAGTPNQPSSSCRRSCHATARPNSLQTMERTANSACRSDRTRRGFQQSSRAEGVARASFLHSSMMMMRTLMPSTVHPHAAGRPVTGRALVTHKTSGIAIDSIINSSIVTPSRPARGAPAPSSNQGGPFHRPTGRLSRAGVVGS